MRWLGLTAFVACAPPPQVKTAVVQRADLVKRVDVSGTLQATVSMPVRPPRLRDVWGFKIVELIPEGTSVEVGTRIARFDTADLTENLQKAENDAESAAAEIRRHRASTDLALRGESLKLAELEAALKKLDLELSQPTDLIASVPLESLRLDREIAALKAAHQRAHIEFLQRRDRAKLANLRSELERATHQVEEFKDHIRRMVVTANHAGTIVYPRNARGEKLKVGERVWRGRTVLKIVSLKKMRGAGDVAEVDSLHLRQGRPATLRVDAHPDTELTGQVSHIGDGFTPKSRTDPSKVIKIKLTVDDQRGLALRPGMRFNGKVEVGRVTDTTVVPLSAVFVGNDGPFVYRKSGTHFDRVPVSVGQRSSTEIEIVGGLDAGDEVSLSVVDIP